MQNKYYYPIKLVEHVRDGLVEQEHSGFVVLSLDGEIKEFGDTLEYPFYLRSCAKPLQAALLIDEKLDMLHTYQHDHRQSEDISYNA